MNEKTQLTAMDALIAWEELEELAETIHAKLLVLELSPHNPVFSYKENRFESNILGFRIVADKKAVAIEENIKFIEYSFRNEKDNKETILFNLYLDKTGNVWLDYNEHRKFSDYNDEDLAKYIYESLIVAIINSDLTKPSVLTG